eukprot:gnl/TRDRNA2_/TRDRNA2_206049_c0_seq1.p1 gnl/TRDRNA2_/TRDRNA2_206049_c0~~gnl/TRDRNA2_/TRDRNA2_206049_c0_seq1.p1  ORF type:complete len:330 (+),score=58.23 gnl/TRDRNA2_/TRDRNA2_206049_c0_seq1:66-992(+)
MSSSADQPCPQVGGRGINPGSWVRRASTEDAQDDIPEEWGWPTEEYTLDELREHVNKMTELEATDGAALDPHALEKGRWYRFPNAKQAGQVYIHSFTKDISVARPKNFIELTAKEKKQLGVSIEELPRALRRIYSAKAIPIVFGSPAAVDAFRTFVVYNEDCQMLDTTKLKRVNPKALEESRRAMVSAMMHGKLLCVHISDHICDFAESICIRKNRDTFPAALFEHGGLECDAVKEQIYRPEDRVGGQCVTRSGFAVFLLVSYDSEGLEMSSSRRDELSTKIPNFSSLEVLRFHCEEDKTQLQQKSLR